MAILSVLLGAPGDGNVLHKFAGEGRGVEAAFTASKKHKIMAREGTGRAAWPMVDAFKGGECKLAPLGGLEARISAKYDPVDNSTNSAVRVCLVGFPISHCIITLVII